MSAQSVPVVAQRSYKSLAIVFIILTVMLAVSTIGFAVLYFQITDCTGSWLISTNNTLNSYNSGSTSTSQSAASQLQNDVQLAHCLGVQPATQPPLAGFGLTPVA